MNESPSALPRSHPAPSPMDAVVPLPAGLLTGLLTGLLAGLRAGLRAGFVATLLIATSTVSLAGQEEEPPDTLLGQDGVYNRPFIGSLGGTSIGGYAEANTNYFQEDGISDGFSMEFRRFNLFVFSSISRRVKLISELEFEHGTEEIKLETALIDFEVSPALILRGGIILPPIAYFNQNHDGPRWEFVERPLVSTEIIPSTLSEVGFGLYGKLFRGDLVLSYDLYLTNGLGDGIIVNEEGRTHIPSGKSEDQFEEDNNGSPALTGRLAVGRRDLGELGVSAYRAKYNTFEIEGDPVAPQRDVTIVAVDLGARVGRIDLRGELAWATIDVPRDLQELFGDEQWGAHVDAVVPVWKPDFAGLENPVVNLALRVEHVDFNVGKFSRTGREIADDVTVIAPGISFRPTSGTVFRANYRRHWINDLLGNPTVNLAGFQLGFATYF